MCVGLLENINKCIRQKIEKMFIIVFCKSKNIFHMSDVEKLRFFFTDFLHNSLRMTIQNITFHSSSLPLNDALIHLIGPVILLIIILKLLIKFLENCMLLKFVDGDLNVFF